MAGSVEHPSTHLEGFSLATKHDFGLINMQTEPWLSVPRFGCRKLVCQRGSLFRNSSRVGGGVEMKKTVIFVLIRAEIGPT